MGEIVNKVGDFIGGAKSTSWLQRFFQANRALSHNYLPYLPLGTTNLFQQYEEIVLGHMKGIQKPVILDVGGGAECCFSRFKPSGSRIICLDISFEQLAQNREADELVLADATREIPLPDASVDLIISRAVIEHLESPQAFFRHSYRVLKPGGHCIHVFPCKIAWFAVINRLLPQNLSREILFYLKPDSRGKGGFPAYYRKCYYTGIKKVLAATGFHVKEIRRYYHQSVYFEFFFPLFLLSAFYEIFTLPVKNFASFLLVVAQKPEER